MISLEKISNLDLIISTDQSRLLFDNNILLSIIDNKTVVCLNHSSFEESFSLLSTLSYSWDDYILLDDDSFENLKKQFIENEMDSNVSDASNIDIEKDISLSDFFNENIDILKDESSAPIIKFVNSIFFQAKKNNASDIHIETHETHGSVFFRIDGSMVLKTNIDLSVASFAINRIKVISHLDTSEKRIPQDGRTQINIDNDKIDVRVSIIPGYHGERAVLRLLSSSSSIPSLSELGFNETFISLLKQNIQIPHGLILVTGPTGSGKSTTLHSCLEYINSPDKNIMTLEDPVEYNSKTINQLQVNDKVGFSFAVGLRSILRQDPDVILLGEIRDNETAKIAIQASITGHLVFSTLHTNDALSSISRLLDIGIEPFMINSSISMIVAQRLVKTLCSCKIQSNGVFIEQGCTLCNNTGFKGRTAIGEIIVFTPELKNIIINGSSSNDLKKYLKSIDFKPLKTQVLELIDKGITSRSELLKLGFYE
jgi:general secretion pathway protein E